MASVEISKDCVECDIAECGYNSKTDTNWIQCNRGWMVDNKPGPLCPGPGVYELANKKTQRVIDEEKIAEMESSLANQLKWHDLNYVRAALVTAGLGKEPNNGEH